MVQQSINPGSSAESQEERLLAEIAALSRNAGVFGVVELRPDDGGGILLSAEARDSGAPASYRVAFEGGSLWVSLVTADRWLSQSIEADLVHTGDKMEDLIEEELVDQGVEGHRPRVEHFRSEDRLFTFRTPVPVRAGEPGAAARAAAFLLAYEACFRNLGDMSGSDED